MKVYISHILLAACWFLAPLRLRLVKPCWMIPMAQPPGPPDSSWDPEHQNPHIQISCETARWGTTPLLQKVVGRLLSYCEGNFSVAMLNFGMVNLEVFSNIKMSESWKHLFEGCFKKKGCGALLEADSMVLRYYSHWAEIIHHLRKIIPYLCCDSWLALFVSIKRRPPHRKTDCWDDHPTDRFEKQKKLS